MSKENLIISWKKIFFPYWPTDYTWSRQISLVSGEKSYQNKCALFYTDWPKRNVMHSIDFKFQANYIMFGWLFGFYGISTIVGYSMPNPFLYK